MVDRSKVEPVRTIDDLRSALLAPTQVRLDSGVIVELGAVPKAAALDIMARLEQLQGAGGLYEIGAAMVSAAITIPDVTDDDAYQLLAAAGGMRGELVRVAAKRCGLSDVLDALIEALDRAAAAVDGEGEPAGNGRRRRRKGSSGDG